MGDQLFKSENTANFGLQTIAKYLFFEIEGLKVKILPIFVS